MTTSRDEHAAKRELADKRRYHDRGQQADGKHRRQPDLADRAGAIGPPKVGGSATTTIRAAPAAGRSARAPARRSPDELGRRPISRSENPLITRSIQGNVSAKTAKMAARGE